VQDLNAVTPALAGLVGVALGVFLGRIGRSKILGDKHRLDTEVSRLESQLREQSRQFAKLRAEQRAVSNFTRQLPEFARNLNRSEIKEQEIPNLVFSLVESIFEPEQQLLYLVQSDHARDRDDDGRILHLTARRGLTEVPASVLRIPVGEGRIGWVASAKVEMQAEDWMNMTRTEGRAIESNHPALRLDLIGPLLHQEKGKVRLFGVLCIGNPVARPRDEKAMLQMVTNLASIAYTNTRNVGRLEELANHDGLTGLLNKRYFMSRILGETIFKADKAATPLTVFVFDIDHFKKYNDTNGHVEGDEILKGVAQVVRQNLRPGDVACRYGGEEFIVLMPGATKDEGHAAAERIRNAIATTKFKHSESQPLGRITISGGVAQFPIDGTEGRDLITHADQALYKAKNASRNKVMMFQGVTIGDDNAEQHETVPFGDPTDDR
jgi:diguanylate cyclase (GGDEF)-like protein